MLTSLTQKLCPLVTLSALFMGIGCGKQIAEQSEQSDTDIQRQVPNSNLALRLSDSSYDHRFPEAGDFLTPIELKVNRGSASTAGKSVSVYYNVTTQGDYDIKCVYVGNPEGDRLKVKDCYKADGAVMGPISEVINFPVWIKKNNFLKIQTTATA